MSRRRKTELSEMLHRRLTLINDDPQLMAEFVDDLVTYLAAAIGIGAKGDVQLAFETGRQIVLGTLIDRIEAAAEATEEEYARLEKD